MAISVRMNPLLEKELELAARQRGMTKSQFIIRAVEQALGRADPAALYHKVMEEAAQYKVAKEPPAGDPSREETALKRRIRTAHRREQDDYAAYLRQRKPAGKEQA